VKENAKQAQTWSRIVIPTALYSRNCEAAEVPQSLLKGKLESVRAECEEGNRQATFHVEIQPTAK